MKHLLIKSILGLALVLLFSVSAQAEVPHVINYQGQLSDSAGNPLDTTVDITFTIYDDDNPGAVVWSETQTVTVVEGLFNVILGTGGGLDYNDFSDSARSMGIQVETDPEMTPLVKLTSVAYSFHARYADSTGKALYAATAGTADHADSSDIAAVAYIAEASIYSDTAGFASTIADDAVNSSKIQDGTILFSDIEQNSAASGQIMKWNGAAWVAGDDISAAPSGWIDGGSVVRLEISSDSVGIGTNTPSEKLEVSGNLRVSGYASVGGTNTISNGSLAAGDSGTASGLYSSVSGGQTNTASGDYSGIGNGSYNVTSGLNSYVGGGRYAKARGNYSFVGGGGTNSATDSNVAVGDYSAIVGGIRNRTQSPYSFIGGGFNNSASHTNTVIAGGQGNSASGQGAAIGGGNSHIASGVYSVVSGGDNNSATSTDATVGGGKDNDATGTNSTVAGGYDNNASGSFSFAGGGIWNRSSGDYAFLGGGGGPSPVDSNQAGGMNSVVSGGRRNKATGNYAIILGGYNCTVSGRNSLAAGTNTSVSHNGSFAWADSSTSSTFNSSADNQFSVRSAGGAIFYSNSALSTGVTMAAGGGSWSSVSDSTVKENITEISGDEILERLSEMKIAKWNYRSQDPSIRHIGPMAQDFFKAFGVGEDETKITTIDADGVALAAIKALYQENRELKKRLEKLEQLIQEKNKN